MFSLKTVRACIAACVFILMPASLGVAEDWAQRYPIAEDVPGPYSFEEMSKKDYRGVTLRIISHEKPNPGSPIERHAKQFEDLTGAKMIVEFSNYKDLYPTIIRGLKQRQYDIICCPRPWFADIAPYLTPLPERVLNAPFHANISSPYQELGVWNGKNLLMEIDGDRHYMQYRKDLLENPKYRAEFKVEYDRELEAPKTWKEYTEVARFFHGRTLESGQVIYGSAEITAQGNLLFAQFFKRAAPYVKHPKVKGGVYFDLNTMKPLINTPGFVEALNDMIEIQEYFPPGGKNFTLVDALTSFGTGQTALSDNWGDAFIKAMEPESPVRNDVAAALSPGARRVWNRNTGQWDEFPEINHVPYLPGSWTTGVTENCQSKDAAFDFLEFYRNGANHSADLLIGQYGMNAILNSDYQESFWIERAGWDEDAVKSYVATLKRFSEHPQHLFILNIHQVGLYNMALNAGLTRALTGRSDPQQALDDVVRKWEKLTERIGVDKQREAYANMLRLEDREY